MYPSRGTPVPSEHPYELVVGVEGGTYVIPYDDDYKSSFPSLGIGAMLLPAKFVAKEDAAVIRKNGVSLYDDTLHLPASEIKFIQVRERKNAD